MSATFECHPTIDQKIDYHFIGIGGIGMSGLAHLLLCQNIAVSGSDISLTPVTCELKKEGAIIYEGQTAENLPPFAKVVYTSDIKPSNPEYQAAIESQKILLHRSDLLAELLKGKRSLAVAGTHGKTTTSSLLATVLVEAGLDPSFAIGGVLPAFGRNARFGRGEYFAFEADESDRSFLKYYPFGAIITNIDKDHLNNYEGSFSLLIENFKRFISQVKFPECLFWCQDDEHLSSFELPGQSYGFDARSHWRILSFHQEGFKTLFDLQGPKQSYSQIELALSGHHNVLNAAAVFAFCSTLGIGEVSIRRAFKTFQGVLRRCENKGTIDHALFLDDYAHHPNEIETTLEGIRQAIGSRRLIAIFQPHRYSRTQDCLGSYGNIFDAADELIITDIYGAGEEPIAHLSSDLIQKEVASCSSIPCRCVPRKELASFASEFIKPSDVVVTLGAGDITKLFSEVIIQSVSLK